MNDRLFAGALGLAAGYAIARAMQPVTAQASGSAPWVYQPPAGTIAALADVAAALYPQAAGPLRAVARGAELLQPVSRAWLIQHGARYAVTTCPPPQGATIVAEATGRTPAEAIANLKP